MQEGSFSENDWSEDRVQEWWNSIQAFQQSLNRSKDRPEFVMFDGPPFATGSPHYGHLVASTIKDIIPRWKTMTGYHVKRRWAWDTHGLPIEFKIEQKLGIKTKQQILDYGIDKYNNECRKIVMDCAEEWKIVIPRLGRWVDMNNDCKTMDTDYMESVWWVFSELYRKGLVYKGYKVIYYSMGCKSPISNFEAKSNYRNVSDWAINVKFKLETSEIALVFTTTPWTLPSNLALAVNPNFEYCKIILNDDGHSQPAQVYIVGKSHLKATLGKRKYKVLETVKGSELVGLRYTPLFSYFTDFSPQKTFRVYGGEFVVEGKGTGLVHCAPAHGEEDYKLCLSHEIIKKTDIPPCPIDDDCNFTDVVSEFKGLNVKESESQIVQYLGTQGYLFSKGKQVHDYPFCWRSDTPLIQKVCECWFVDVPQITEKLIENNSNVNWIPETIGKNRFGEWLKNSQEWCVSRNRFWGTPLNLWSNDDGSEVVCVSNIDELERRTNLPTGTISDIHREFIDDITIPSQIPGNPPLKRVEYVFDCWFESGSIPYAQQHYPFKEGSEFKQADFIAEGLDQTRGWFYTLLVIGTGLFGVSPYKNVLVNGIVLAEDGQKMSKRKENYPPVQNILDEFGADALRLYLIDTQVVRAGDIKFSKDAIREVARRYSMMLKNATKFFMEMVGIYQKSNTGDMNTPFNVMTLDEIKNQTREVMDEWILQCLNELIVSVHRQMDKYELNGIVDKFYRFIDQLSRWYMNLNKKRYKSCESRLPIDILGVCLYYFTLISAPFAPFIAESVYQQLRCYNIPDDHLYSIHYHQIPEQGVWDSDGNLLDLFDYTSDIVDMVREIRGQRECSSAKMPLNRIRLIHNDWNVLDKLRKIGVLLESELNIEHLVFDQREGDYVDYDVKLDVSQLKKRVQGRQIGEVMKYVNGLSVEQKCCIARDGCVPNDSLVWFSELSIIKQPLEGKHVKTTNKITLEYDATVTPRIRESYFANQFHRAYQQARKDARLVQTDAITFEYHCDEKLNKILVASGVVAKNNGVYVKEPIDPDLVSTYLICTKPKLELGEVTILLRK